MTNGALLAFIAIARRVGGFKVIIRSPFRWCNPFGDMDPGRFAEICARTARSIIRNV